MIRFALISILTLTVGIEGVAAQSLRSRIADLFSFGDCGEPLCLDGSISAATGHGDHFIPSVAAGNSTIITFLAEAIGLSVSSAPVSAASSGATFQVVGGVPVMTSTSSGPILAERSRTLGRGRVFVGVSVTNISFSSINSVPLDNMVFNFVHEDAGTPILGDPAFENDVIEVRVDLDVRVLVSSLFLTVGATDFIDLGVSVPFVRTSINGASEAQIQPFGPPALHFFGGDLTNPILRAATSVAGSATGVGDIAGRLKINLGQSNTIGAAIMGEVRFPTGDEENLLGLGSTAIRALAAIAAEFGNFSPHANVGYFARTGEFQNDAILATLGFDQLMTSWATLAFELVSEWQVGDNKIELPEAVRYEAPYIREVQTTSFPPRRSDVLNASVGMKLAMRGGTNLVMNGILPLRRNGIQADFIWTGGLEIVF